MFFWAALPKGGLFLFKIFHMDWRADSSEFAFGDVKVIHTFASMAGRTQGQSLAAQLRK